MKSLIRIPTTQYGYLEVEFEGTPQEIIDKHNELLLLYNGGFGLEPKEFNKALDRYLNEGTGETEVYLQMSKEQQRVFQEIKKSIARTQRRNGDTN